MQTKKRLIAIGDVVGFKNLLTDIGTSKLSSSYADLISHAKSITPRTKGMCFMVASDTILVASARIENAEHHDRLSTFFSVVARIFIRGLEKGFPMRIGMAYGETVVRPDSGLYLGDPILRAYRMQECEERIGCALDPSCFDVPLKLPIVQFDKSRGCWTGMVVEYDVPLKSKCSNVATRWSANRNFKRGEPCMDAA